MRPETVSIRRPRPPIKVLGRRYVLRDLLGQGGMGSVYEGQDQLTGQRVAIKVLRASMHDDPHAVARIQREADIAVRLTHPQVVRIYGVVNGPGDGPAIVMELLDGPTLQKVVEERGPLRPTEVAAIGHRLAGVLGYLADEQIVRLDLKPSNIIIEAERGPVIIDLGLARMLENSRSQLNTTTGSIIGTPMYMAPELIQGLRPDSRADLYALGLVLYYCLAGESPWIHLTSMPEIMYAIVNQPIDVSRLAVSKEFSEALVRTLARKPEDRFPGAAEFRKALEATPEWRSDEAPTRTMA